MLSRSRSCPCAALGVLVGLPALRLKGLYLAVSTLAAHFVIIVGLSQYQAAISYGSGFSIASPSIVGVELSSTLSSGSFSAAIVMRWGSTVTNTAPRIAPRVVEAYIGGH